MEVTKDDVSENIETKKKRKERADKNKKRKHEHRSALNEN